MPELPEVETTLQGIKPHILQAPIVDVIVRHPTLRWPIPSHLKDLLLHQTIQKIDRRGKYLLLATTTGTMILHLGMSGSIRILEKNVPAEKHDHLDIVFKNNKILRFTDPRRFGAILWTDTDPNQHPLLASLGPEPLEPTFTGKYLWSRAQKRKAPIKSFIMDSKIVVGVGNIYATEALFAAKIHPKKAAGKISLPQYEILVKAIKQILKSAIKQGGTTLKDFMHSEGKKGYFRIELKAYGRGGEPCTICHKALKEIRQAQRSTVYCHHCQK